MAIIKYKTKGKIFSVEVNIKKELVEEININLEKIKRNQNKIYKSDKDIRIFKTLNKNKITSDIYLPKNFRQFDIQSEKRYEIIREKNGDFTLQENSNKVGAAYKIAIVLESPHVSEYDGNFQPNGPVKKLSTSNRIKNNIINIIKKIEPYCEGKNQFDIYLVNPVKFQASLGSFYTSKLNEEIRNRLWKTLYDNVYKEEFLEEMKEYNVIINACTYINNNSGKKQITRDLLENKYKYKVIECTKHPSRWDKNTEFWIIENIFKL